MPLPPKRTTNVSPGGDAWNKLGEIVRSHQPLQSPGLLTGHTTHGVTREVELPTPTYGGGDDGAEIEMMDCVTGKTYLVRGRIKPDPET